MTLKEPVLKKGNFDSIAYSFDKECTNSSGELELTVDHLRIKSKVGWSKNFFLDSIEIGVKNNLLEIRNDNSRVFFRISIDNPNSWEDANQKLFDKKGEIVWLQLEL